MGQSLPFSPGSHALWQRRARGIRGIRSRLLRFTWLLGWRAAQRPPWVGLSGNQVYRCIYWAGVEANQAQIGLDPLAGRHWTGLSRLVSATVRYLSGKLESSGSRFNPVPGRTSSRRLQTFSRARHASGRCARRTTYRGRALGRRTGRI